MTTPTSSPLLLAANDLRVDSDGVPLCERLALRAGGERVVLAGVGADAIAGAVTLRATIAAGRLLFDGHDVAKREHLGRVGIAPLDPPLPPRMTVEGYVSLSLRTAGFDKKTARSSTTKALMDLGVGPLTSRRTESLAIPERRATVLAASCLPSARAVFAEAPIHGLEGAARQYVLTVLGRLAEHRRVLATTARFDANSAERELLLGATDVVLLDRSDVLWSGPPAELLRTGPLMAVSVRDNTDTFMKALGEEGIAAQGAPPRFTISRTSDDTPTRLLAIAERTNTAVVEMMPIVTPTSPLPEQAREQEPTHA